MIQTLFGFIEMIWELGLQLHVWLIEMTWELGLHLQVWALKKFNNFEVYITMI